MVKVNTQTLQAMVGKLSKITGNKLLEITRYYSLVVDENGLTITGTDGNNYLKVMDATVTGDAMNIIIKGDQFSKLVSRTTVKELKLTLRDSYLEIVGNGKYKVEVLVDEEYPSWTFKNDAEGVEINVAALKGILSTNKFAISNNIADGVLNGYYFGGSKAITADGIKVCVSDMKFMDNNVLITKELMDLLCTVTDEKATLQYDGGKILVTSSNTIVYGTEFEGIDEYPDILPLVDTQLPSKCSVSKLMVLNVLDRLSLFIDVFEKNEVILAFTNEGLVISTNSGSYEGIMYVSSENFTEFTCCVNGVYFKELVQAVTTENFELHYGDETLIKICSANMIELLATGEDEEEGE